MTNQRLPNYLSDVYRMLDAGEKGFAVSAANVKSRGLKVLLKSYAQQRARFKNEILLEMQRLSGHVRTRYSLGAAIHRGRINIFSTLSIRDEARERAVLKEIMIGERAVLRTYFGLMNEELPENLHAMLARHYQEIHRVFDQVQRLSGQAGKRLVLRLFDSEFAAESAVQELAKAGFSPDTVERVSFDEAFDFYKGQCTTVSETLISGAIGGAFWGSLIGPLAGIGMQFAGLAPVGIAHGGNFWVFLAFAAILAGALIGSVLGFVIGLGIRGEDQHLYEQSIQHGRIILLAMVDALRASEAKKIMAGITRTSWGRAGKSIA